MKHQEMRFRNSKTSLRLIEFDIDEIFQYLLSSNIPVTENKVLYFITKLERLPKEREKLYEIHFSLYHALYILKQKAGKNGYYIHLEPMKIRLIKIPDDNHCHHYLPERGCFCNSSTERSGYCRHHIRLYQDRKDKLSFDPLEEFYINPDNIVFGTGDLLKRLMRGIIIYAFKKGEVKKALEYFDISYPNRKIIQRRYHEFAKIYHPDKPSGDAVKMKLLNKSYQILQEIFII